MNKFEDHHKIPSYQSHNINIDFPPYSYHVQNLVESEVTWDFDSSFEFYKFAQMICEENEDKEFYLIDTLTRAERYIEEYCANLELTRK